MSDTSPKDWPKANFLPLALSRAAHGLTQSAAGTALIEYALLIGALACVVIASIQFSDDMGIPVFRRLAGSLISSEAFASSADVQSPHALGEDGLQTVHDLPWQARAHRAVARPATVLYLATILTTLLWLITRRSRKKHEKEEAAASVRKQSPLHAKRQILWKNILDDPQLLLKNRIEVRHLMTKRLSVIAQRTPTDEIHRLMEEKHIHHVLVCDSDGGLLGVVSDRDLQSGAAKTAAEAMTANPMTVRPDTTAGAAIAMMLEHQFSCVPVMDDEQICGILTRTDLLLSLQCMLQWWLRFAQTLARAAECSDKIDSVQEATGQCLFKQRIRFQSLNECLGPDGKPSENSDWASFATEAEAFLATAGELIAMQTFEGDRLSELAGDLLEIAKP